jgi:hypothetical protein
MHDPCLWSRAAGGWGRAEHKVEKKVIYVMRDEYCCELSLPFATPRSVQKTKKEKGRDAIAIVWAQYQNLSQLLIG